MVQIELGLAATCETALPVVGPLPEAGKVRSTKVREAFGGATIYYRDEIAAIGKL